MPRKAREYSPEIAYHVIVRGNNRQTLFRKDEDFEKFLFIIRFLKSEFKFNIYHYCLMSNHVHLLANFPNEPSFKKVPQRLFLLYAKYFAREYSHVGHVFQDRFKSFPVKDNRYLLECGRYIERNPLKAKIVERPGDYRWSSVSYYEGRAQQDILTENPFFRDLGMTEDACRAIYKDFVAVERPYELEIEQKILGQERRNQKVSL